MGATQQYAIIDPQTGKMDRRIFIDQAIYDEEMAKIFGFLSTFGDITLWNIS